MVHAVVRLVDVPIQQESVLVKFDCFFDNLSEDELNFRRLVASPESKLVL